MPQLDILSVGDVVTDAFIKLPDDKAQAVEDDKGGKWLAVPFGTKMPYDHVEIAKGVGNAANAAVSFARLGLNAGFVTNVGGDSEGRDIIDVLHKAGVKTNLIRINHDKKSNYHYVLWYKEERTILIRHEDYDYEWPHLRAQEIPRWVYFSSISQHAIPYHDEVADWLDDHPEVRMALQPGTYQMQAGAERLKRIYKHTDILVLNREEAVLVSGGDYDDIHGLFDRLHALGPQVVLITDGPAGAYASDGTQRLKMPLYPDPAPPLERTGAGDAFASAFVAAAAKGLSLEDALMWAPINSMSVVQKVGAQAGLLSERQIHHYLSKAPKNYHPKSF